MACGCRGGVHQGLKRGRGVRGRWAGLGLAAVWGACAGGPANGSGTAADPLLIDDFSVGVSKWKDKGSGTVETRMEAVDGVGRFTITGERGEGCWSDLHVPILWPEGAAAVACRARAERPCAVEAKLVEGRSHNEMEHFGARLELTPEWREFRLAPADFARVIWSSEHEPDRPNRTLDLDRVRGFGFVEIDFPVTFEVDDVRFVR